MIDDITAPAPRLILRLFCLQQYLNLYVKENNPVDTACEIGPGLGDTASFMIRQGYVENWHLYESADYARELLEQRFSGVSEITLRNEFSENTTGIDKYGLVLCCEVIEHIENDELFIQSIASSVKPNGLFYGSVPAYQKKWQSVDELAGHYRRYERKELKDKLTEAGFEVLDIACYGFPLINLMYPLRESYYRKQLKKNSTRTKREATASSGIARNFSMKFDKKLVFMTARFFSLFQSLPLWSNLGDGFVFVARKRP